MKNRMQMICMLFVHKECQCNAGILRYRKPLYKMKARCDVILVREAKTLSSCTISLCKIRLSWFNCLDIWYKSKFYWLNLVKLTDLQVFILQFMTRFDWSFLNYLKVFNFLILHVNCHFVYLNFETWVSQNNPEICSYAIDYVYNCYWVSINTDTPSGGRHQL